ncbi:hypothetical protein [Ectobacillus panaciterrae]|nr:hypothetical protein [Ectobacillus panaciterrae]
MELDKEKRSRLVQAKIQKAYTFLYQKKRVTTRHTLSLYIRVK